MSKRIKDSGPHPAKRKSSLGLRNRMNVTVSEESQYEMPSTSRPQAMQRISNSFQRSNDNFGSSRIPRAPPKEMPSRRSSSQDPPSRRTCGLSPASHMHLTNVGVLLTPVRPTPSRSPSIRSMASNSRASAARRASMNLNIQGPNTKQKDVRPITDKNFQSNAIARIQNFFHSETGQQIYLKPMSNTVLIKTFNAIVGQLDENLCVSSANYVEKIPSILTSLQYPAVLSRTTIVGVGTERTAQQLIAMLIWLLESVQAIKMLDPEKSLFPKANVNEEEKSLKGTVLTLFEGYAQFKQGKTEFTVDEFADILGEKMGDSRDVENQLNEDISDLQQKIQNIVDDPMRYESEEKIRILDEVETKLEELEKRHTHLAETINTAKSKIMELRESVKQLDTVLERLDDQAAEIRDMIERQSMKATDRDEIKQKCEYLRQEISSKATYNEKLQEMIAKIDIDMSHRRKEVGDIIQDINCIVLENELDDSLKWRHNPLNALSDSDYPRNMLHLWSNIYHKTTKEIESMKAALTNENTELAKMQDDLKKLKSQVASKTEECMRLDGELISTHYKFSEAQQKLLEDIEEEKSLCSKLQTMLNSKHKLENIENEIRRVLDEKQLIHEEFEKQQHLNEQIFFPRLKAHIEQYQDILLEQAEELRIKYLEDLSLLRKEKNILLRNACNNI